MFKKHSMLAAAALLAAAISTAGAECTGCIPRNMGFNPTQGINCAEICCTNTTFSSMCATFQCLSTTCKDHIPTSAAIFGTDYVISPTVFPQQAAAQTLSASTGVDYTTQSLLMQEQKMANLLAQDRKNNGRAALTLDEELCRIARIKSADMRDNGYFAHESPTYGDVRAMLKQFGYTYTSAGENIAHHANVDKAQAAFMSSPGHRANILSAAWTKVGIGIVYDSNGYIYATQIFAR